MLMWLKPPLLLLLSLLATTWTLPGTGADEHDPRSVRSVYEARTHNVVLQEWDLSCGAASLATVLRYQHGLEVTEREVALGLIDREEYYENPDLVGIRQGFSLLDMKRYVDRLGYVGVGIGNMRFSDLLERTPVIVPVDLHGFPHFVVFRGAARDRVLLANPAFGNMTLGRDRFEAAWIKYPDLGHVGFVVRGHDGEQTPPATLAPTSDEFLTFG
jgi:predicted double-glycine peptidase